MKKILVPLVILGLVLVLVAAWFGYKKWFSPDRIMTGQECTEIGGTVVADTGEGVKFLETGCGLDGKQIGIVPFGQEGGICCVGK